MCRASGGRGGATVARPPARSRGAGCGPDPVCPCSAGIKKYPPGGVRAVRAFVRSCVAFSKSAVQCTHLRARLCVCWMDVVGSQEWELVAAWPRIRVVRSSSFVSLSPTPLPRYRCRVAVAVAIAGIPSRLPRQPDALLSFSVHPYSFAAADWGAVIAVVATGGAFELLPLRCRARVGEVQVDVYDEGTVALGRSRAVGPLVVVMS
ncbi:uncharacterized protein K452DRAFT_81200 [Aplosporella prunicola CBS 121167]|uniref:Uncharacterized protein n=1 Tax=Aplosporella prunicola CBS 121167 TaxID=1176127 RepID=A0A6A6B7D6_9PEZI|nr:uncharacterized protein K452DRAFT_81200 [Aplosporella prunicola CBS 121167]KAF2139124.1 hypothetical protein K452DRAFT_81200 [Aplosporella prunicola CBS 121167]